VVRVLYSPGHEFPQGANRAVIKSAWRSSPFQACGNAGEITLT
jgi:hypothetical protein